jgi:WD40 repeat protein
LPTGRERATLRGHDGSVTDCGISPDGRYVLSVSEDSTLRVWEAAGGGERATLALPARLTCLAMHPWRPFAICSDGIGAVYQASVVGVEYGRILATAIDSGDGLRLHCPFCRSSFSLKADCLGQSVDCPQPGCRGRLQVNSFVG